MNHSRNPLARHLYKTHIVSRLMCPTRCSEIRQVTVKQMQKDVVLLSMTQEERNTIISVWNDMVLRGRLEDDPYSLSQDELTSLQSNDRLNERIDSLSRNKVLLKAALKSYISQA